MLDIRFREKIQLLKQRFIDADDTVLAQIREWEAEIQRLSIISDFINLHPVQVISKLLRERIKAILIEKATKGTSDTLDAREKELRYVLELFSPKYQSELESLEKIIENELI